MQSIQSNEEKAKQQGLSENQRGIITLCGGFVLMLVAGTVFLWGSLNLYITSYFRTLNEPIKLSTGGALFPVMMASLATGIPVGMKMLRYFRSARVSCIVSGFFSALTVFLSSYTSSFWQFVLVYGVLHGFFQGTIYFIPIYMGYLYYPKKRGMVAGITTGGFAMCAFVFGQIFFQIVNPDSLASIKNEDGFSYFEKESIEVAENVPSTLRLMSYIYFSVASLSSMFLLYHPNQIGEDEIRAKIQSKLKESENQLQTLEMANENVPLQESPIKPTQIEAKETPETKAILSNEDSKGQQQESKVEDKIPHTNQIVETDTFKPQEPVEVVLEPELIEDELTEKEIEELNKRGSPSAAATLRQPQFYMSILLGILTIGIGVLVNGNFKSIAKDAGYSSDSYQTLIGSVGGIMNGLSRPLWATLLDHFTFKQIISVIIGIEIVFSFTLRFTDSSEELLLIWIAVIHMTLGATLGMWPVLSAQMNGVKVGAQLFGMYWYGFSIANFIQFILVLVLKTEIGFDNIYYLFTAMSIVALLIVQFYDFKIHWSKYYIQEMKNQKSALKNQIQSSK